jgi:homoserine O-succinyltransferase
LEKKSAARMVSIDSRALRGNSLRVALINNMPDAALEDTELQFFDLLDSVSDDLPVFLKLYSLTGVPRSDRGMRYLNRFYFSIDDLWNSHFDAVIVTGTEPHQPNLKQEPYWPYLVKLLEWAERNTFSTVLSCLAAHAGVLHGDGIERHRLADKRFGVFDFAKVNDNLLTSKADSIVRFPHSRWNEVRANDLQACGYTVLTQSDDAGVDSFSKKRKQSLFLHFQGHPEYTEYTLLKEYRRDITRFLSNERETYPTMPQGYFGSEANNLLSQFRETALRNGGEEAMAPFPDDLLLKQLHNTWRSSATQIYRNWLRYVQSRKNEFSTIPFISSDQYRNVSRKRTASP